MNVRLQVSRWLKALMQVIAIMPGLASFAVLVPHRSWPGPNVWLNIAGAVLLLGSSVWLVRRIHFLCSLVMTDAGLEQSVLGLRAGHRKLRLSWDQVSEVRFSGLSFHFLGQNGEKLEMNTSLFGDSAE